MTRSRIVTFVLFAAVAGLGLTALMAAKDLNEKGEAPTKPPSPDGKKLVCMGNVDTEDPVVRIFPDNFPAPSKVTKVLVHEGDDVKEGQKLLDFDVEFLQLKVEEADKAILVAKNDKEKAEAMVKAFQPQLDASDKELQAERQKLIGKLSLLEDIRRAHEKGGIKTKSEVEEAEAAYKAAQLSLEAAQVKWQGLKDIGAPDYLVRSADKNIEHKQNLKKQAELAVRQFSCKAPADGRILRSFVSEGITFGPHTREPAFWFLKKSPLIVRAEVSQEFARRVSKGAAAEIEDEADPNQKWKGKVFKVGDQFLPKRNTGGTVDLLTVSDERVLECLVSIDAAEGKGPRYGQKVRVTLGN